MQDELKRLAQELKKELGAAQDIESLENVKTAYLGRKGTVTALLKGIADLSPEEKKTFGVIANEVRQDLDEAVRGAEARILQATEAGNLKKEWIDTSLPGLATPTGHLHLTTQAIKEVTQIFERLGFTRARHPEIDWDYYAFESLNIPKGHPARDEWETFFVADGDQVQEGAQGKVVLTPHTSNAQVRQMQKQEPPIRMINIGKTYRRQASVRHLTMFHQFEGLYVDKNVSLADLKGIIEYFAQEFFGPGRQIRLRPHHFRFTEPSFEVDISAEAGREGEKLFKGGWLELGGAGMVHPNVLRAAGLDPDVYTGFAFGWGVERTMMMKSGMNIDDIRIMYKNDLRFLEQF